MGQTFAEKILAIKSGLRSVKPGQIVTVKPDLLLSHDNTAAIIDKIQEADKKYAGVVLNAAAYTHTSVAIADAVKAVSIPVVEVHISNILEREEFRHKSLISPNCIGSIMGFGLDSYRLGIESLRILSDKK